MIRKTITIEEDQAAWLKDNHINLSALIRDKIEEERRKKK